MLDLLLVGHGFNSWYDCYQLVTNVIHVLLSADKYTVLVYN